MSSNEESFGVTYTSISSNYEEPSDVGAREQAPLSLDYVSGTKYPEYLAPSNEEFLVEDQPYAAIDSPIALSPGYIADSNPEDKHMASLLLETAAASSKAIQHIQATI
ncbi:hypothetical protein Tco_0673779 [Tanacetum coccineum]